MAPATAAARRPLAPSPDADAVRVKLEPQDGGDAGGQGLFGLATADQLFLDLDVHGLEQPAPDQSYVVWLLLTPGQGYPISPFDVDAQGNFSDRFPIPRFAVSIAGRARYLDVGLSNRAELQAEVGKFAQSLNKTAAGAELPILDYSGDSVLRGAIPSTGGPALLDGGGSLAQELAGVHDPGRVEPLLDARAAPRGRARPPPPPCRGRGRGRPRGGG